MWDSKFTAGLFLALMLSACSGDGDVPSTETSNPSTNPEDNNLPIYTTPDGVAECSIEDVKLRVEFDMRDYYIYYDQVPAVQLSDYDTPESLIRALRIEPDIYSYVTDKNTQSDLSNNGITADFGFNFRPAADGVVRFLESRLGSPAHEAGVRRGDELIEFNGRPIAEITNGEINAELTPENSPVVMTIRTGAEEPRTVSVENNEYVWKTAGHEARFTSTSNPSLPAVGYLSVRSFLNTTKDEIDSALLNLANQGGFDELIIDLRYNGGGRTWVARHLASLIGGVAVADNVFLIRKWNDKYSFNDEQSVFDTVSNPLNLSRVIVLTTGRSASASEVIINTLEPYIDVVVIGDVTSGKPFTSNAKEYCEKSINAMRSIRTNAVGVSVAGGIQPDCLADDNWETPLNSVRDPLVSSALYFVANNSCRTAAPAAILATRDENSHGPIFDPEDQSQYVPEE